MINFEKFIFPVVRSRKSGHVENHKKLWISSEEMNFIKTAEDNCTDMGVESEGLFSWNTLLGLSTNLITLSILYATKVMIFIDIALKSMHYMM